MIQGPISELWNYFRDVMFFVASAIILFLYFHNIAGKDSYRTNEVVHSSGAILKVANKASDTGGQRTLSFFLCNSYTEFFR